jgi:hypothetical protein
MDVKFLTDTVGNVFEFMHEASLTWYDFVWATLHAIKRFIEMAFRPMT